MERRSEPRISSNQVAWLTVWCKTEVRCRATAIDLSGRGMKLTADWPFATESAVKVEIDDTLYLGEICYCKPENDGFTIGIEVDQVLTGMRDLAQLHRRLTEDMPLDALPEHADATRGNDEQWQLRQLVRARS